MRPRVLEMTISTNYNIDHIDRAGVGRLISNLRRPAFAVKHTRNSFSLLVVTRETAKELMNRLTPAMEAITGFENWWINSVGYDCVARHDRADPFMQRFEKAWRIAERIGHRTQAEDLRSLQPDDIFAQHGIEEFDRKAAVKMGLRPRGQRETPPDADKPESQATHDADSLRKQAEARQQAEALFSPRLVTPDLSAGKE